jgi:hypothetical protein
MTDRRSKIDSGIAASLFPVPFRFSNRRTLHFNDALPEITCAPEFLSEEAQRIDLSFDDIVYRWEIIASEETEVRLSLLMASSQSASSGIHPSSPFILGQEPGPKASQGFQTILRSI